MLAVSLAVVLPTLALGGYIAFQLNRQYFPRFDLPAFDAAKAAQLTPEKRAAYEQELFGELLRWNMGSRRYPNRDDFIRREQRWQQMADDGLELAHITLSVLRPSNLQVYALSGPMKRLEALAEHGDTGAMCLMTGLVVRAASTLRIDGYAPLYKKWLERGAEFGHPECLMQLGGRLLLGVDGYPQDIHRGLSLDFAARRAGYANDASALILYFMGLGFADPQDVRRLYDGKPSPAISFAAYKDLANVRRLYCWTQIEGQSSITDVSSYWLKSLRREAVRTDRPELAALHDELQGKHYSLQDCVNLGTGE